MRLAVITDLHLGHAGQGAWHNRLLYDHAEEIARAAVEALNREQVDAAYVLGDLTQAGEERQLVLARTILSGLSAPWFVLPGNHDGPAVGSGLFDAVFREHVVPDLVEHDGLAIAALREQRADRGGGSNPQRLDEAHLDSLSDQLRNVCSETLVFVSHLPLIDEAEWAGAHGGKDAGHYENGPSWLRRAAGLAGRVASLCGHQHWHHVVADPGRLHCATAALIEYPIEARIVTREAGRLTGRLLEVAPTLAGESLDAAAWVRGRTEDREWSWG